MHIIIFFIYSFSSSSSGCAVLRSFCEYSRYHFPFCTDVRSRAQDDQETCLIGQIQKMLQISISCEVEDPRCCFVEVPGDVSVWRGGWIE